MTISDKLNEIEVRTRELAGEAQELAEWKAGLDALLECSVHDHDWHMDEQPVSSLREVFTIILICKRCKCHTLFNLTVTDKLSGDPNRRALEVIMPTGELVSQFIPEEDE